MKKNESKRFFAEGIGTFFIIFFGLCSFIYYSNSYVAIALVFGIAVMAAYVLLHKLSGAHMNPAITVATLIDGRIKVMDSIFYMVSQFIGAFAAMGVYKLVVNSLSVGVITVTSGYALQSALGTGVIVALLIEALLSFAFALVFLAASDRLSASKAGVVIGLTFTMATLVALPFTLAGLNPAKSLATAFFEGGIALEQAWVFVLAPIVGAIAAALVYGYMDCLKETESTHTVNSNEQDRE